MLLLKNFSSTHLSYFIFSIERAVCGDKTGFVLILRHIQVYSQEVTQRQRASTKLVVEHTREVKLGKQEIFTLSRR